MLRKDFRMLKLEYLFENYELAREALALWEHDEDNLEEMLGYFRISSNAVYPFTREGRVCFLRLAPVGEKAETDVRGELEFIRYLLKEGYPALRPVRSLSGEDMVVADTGFGRYFACVFEKVDGVEISEAGYGREVMYAYGRALGRLHALSSGYVPAVRKQGHKEILEWIRRTLEEYGGCREAFTELAAVERELGRLLVTTENYGLVHYDFEPDNVFWDEGKKNAASLILMTEFIAGTGWILSRCGILLRRSWKGSSWKRPGGIFRKGMPACMLIRRKRGNFFLSCADLWTYVLMQGLSGASVR